MADHLWRETMACIICWDTCADCKACRCEAKRSRIKACPGVFATVYRTRRALAGADQHVRD